MAQQFGADTKRVAALREGIERWRQARPKTRPMPAPLWEEAVCLARQHGVFRIKAALGLNFESLKERVERRSPASACASSSFIEMSGAQLLMAGSVVEVSDGHGRQLTVRLAPGSALDVAQLVAAFGRREP